MFITNNIIGFIPEQSDVGDPLFVCEWSVLSSFGARDMGGQLIEAGKVMGIM